MLKSSTLVFLFALSAANCQFFYNYEEESPEEPRSQIQDTSSFQYNPPSTVNQQFSQAPRSYEEPSTEAGQRRTRIRVRSRNYNSDPEYVNTQQQNQAPESELTADQRAVRQQRRQARRRERQNDYIQPTLSTRIYSPSIFENIGLGEAPGGIYIPQDSFLNVLRNPSRNTESTPSVSQPIVNVNQATNYLQPSVSYLNDGQRFFVQPPSNEEPRQPNLILPVSRSQIDYIVPSPRRTVSRNRQIMSPSLQGRAVDTNRRTRHRMRIQAEYSAPPTPDIDVFRESTDDVIRENVMSQVQYVQPVTQIRRRRLQETTPAARVYSPSVFEKVDLGEPPRGIYVPEDSLLNILRNPNGHRVSRQEPRQLPPQQPILSAPEEYEDDIIEEEQYQPPPPAPSPPRRHSSQRSRKAQLSRSSEPQNAQAVQTVQSVHTSSQRRNQRINDEYEDFERRRPSVQQRTQPQRRLSHVSAPAPRSQIQASTSDRGDTTFKKAKLVVAELPLDTDDDGIPGVAGENYPTLHVIPKTSFSCSQQPLNGYYADLETSCQVVHLCQSGGVQNSFLCPNGTIFSQEKFSCQWWYKVNCNDAPKFYVKNDELYKIPEKKERKRN